MHRTDGKLAAAFLLCAWSVLCVSRPARAQEFAGAQELGDARDPEYDYISDREVGLRLGVQGGVLGITPGGARVGAVLVYRLDDLYWFDGELSFTFGGGSPVCATRTNPTRKVCDPGVVDGFSTQLLGGVRWYLGPYDAGLVGFVRVGLGAELVRFAPDGLTGFAVPAWGGVGGRFRLRYDVSVGGEVLVQAGPGFYGDGVGAQPYAAILFQVGAELGL